MVLVGHSSPHSEPYRGLQHPKQPNDEQPRRTAIQLPDDPRSSFTSAGTLEQTANYLLRLRGTGKRGGSSDRLEA